MLQKRRFCKNMFHEHKLRTCLLAMLKINLTFALNTHMRSGRDLHRVLHVVRMRSSLQVVLRFQAAGCACLATVFRVGLFFRASVTVVISAGAAQAPLEMRVQHSSVSANFNMVLKYCMILKKP